MKKHNSSDPSKAGHQDTPHVGPVHYDISLLSDDDLFIFNEGNHFRLYEKLGSHCLESEGIRGVYFAVWAPDAEQVYVIGDFNDWHKEAHPLGSRGQSGIWEGFIPGVYQGSQV